MPSEVLFAALSALALGGGTLSVQLLVGGALILPRRCWRRSRRRRTRSATAAALPSAASSNAEGSMAMTAKSIYDFEPPSIDGKPAAARRASAARCC